MIDTELEYLSEPFRYEGEAIFIGAGVDPKGRSALILDRTIFYPQGGGQASDRGLIETQGQRIPVDAVSFHEGLVYHACNIGSAKPAEGEQVSLRIDTRLRRENSRLHSGGHLILNAMKNAGQTLRATKGYHFGDGAYVEFAGLVPDDFRDSLVERLQAGIEELIAKDLAITWAFVDYDELKTVCENVPANVPTNKPTRVITIGNVSQPCGGTHVRSLKELQGMRIEKIRSKKGETRVSYSFV